MPTSPRSSSTTRACATRIASERSAKAGASPLTRLSFEALAPRPPDSSGGLLDVERLIALARERGLTSDPVMRDRLARLVIELRVMSLTIRRARDTRRSPAGPGPRDRA